MITSNLSSPARPLVAPRRPFNGQKLALEAATRAMKLRRRLGIGLHEAVCPFDIAHKIGVEVRFQNVPSMDGVYCQPQNRPPLIVLASERPAGRQNFTCGHELGHHEFGHGTRLDEFLDDVALQSLAQSEVRRRRQNNPEEFLADRFASFLLMPKSAVDRAFAKRNIDPATAGPLEIYLVACCLGVGYRTLVEHLCFSLGSISAGHADELRPWATRLPKLRAAIARQPVRHITVVDEAWETRPIDLVVDDLMLMPHGWSYEGDGLESVGSTSPLAWRPGELIKATRQGTGALLTPERRQLLVRVSRRGFVGLARYRHLHDPDEDLDEGDAL